MLPRSNDDQLVLALAEASAAGPLTKEILDAVRPFITRVREEAAKDRNYGMSDPFGLFLRKMYFLNPQSYGGRVQNYFSSKFGYEIVPAKLNLGDFKSVTGDHFEFKFSFADFTTPCLNLVQIRLFQRIDGYYCMVADVRQGFKPYVFKLTKSDMECECDALGATSAHGTKEVVAANTHRELRASIQVDAANVHFARWLERYLDREKTGLLVAEL